MHGSWRQVKEEVLALRLSGTELLVRVGRREGGQVWGELVEGERRVMVEEGRATFRNMESEEVEEFVAKWMAKVVGTEEQRRELQAWMGRNHYTIFTQVFLDNLDIENRFTETLPTSEQKILNATAKEERGKETEDDGTSTIYKPGQELENHIFNEQPKEKIFTTKMFKMDETTENEPLDLVDKRKNVKWNSLVLCLAVVVVIVWLMLVSSLPEPLVPQDGGAGQGVCHSQPSHQPAEYTCQ